jgi:hypothetical protein
MAQTKRKRRSKHRGNAVGVVEARGRTSKPREGAKPSGSRSTARGAGQARPLKPPTFKGSAIKALVGTLVLFLFFRFLTKGNSTAQALTMCTLAFVLYTPIMYLTDRWIYKRKVAQAAGGRPAR